MTSVKSTITLFSMILLMGAFAVVNVFGADTHCVCEQDNIPIRLNSLNISASASGTISADSELNSQGVAPVSDWSVNVGGATGLTFKLNSTSLNTVTAVPPSGIDADITVELNAHIDFNGERYDSSEPLKLNGHVSQWPPTQTTVYTLQNTVDFDGPCGRFTLSAGAEVSVSPVI